MTQGEFTLSRARGAKAQKRIQAQENTINFNQALKQHHRHIELVPKTRNQENLILKLLDPSQHIVVAVGPAGTGKTYLAMQAAIKALKTGHCERIILTRPAVGVDLQPQGDGGVEEQRPDDGDRRGRPDYPSRIGLEPVAAVGRTLAERVSIGTAVPAPSTQGQDEVAESRE